MINILKNKTYQVFGVLIALILLCRKPKDDLSKKNDLSDNYEPNLGTRVSKLDKSNLQKNKPSMSGSKPTVHQFETNNSIKDKSTYLNPKVVKPFVNTIDRPRKGQIKHGKNSHIKHDLTHLQKPLRNSSTLIKDIPIFKPTRPRKEIIVPNKPF